MDTISQCCMHQDRQQSQWFHVRSGVRQGCVISPFFLHLIIDWVMKRATGDKPIGIVWVLTAWLEDCDFADDIAQLSRLQNDIQEKTDRVDKAARSVGLNIDNY